MRTFEWNDGKDHYRPPNPYYEPEACGLELLLEFDEPNLSYEYNTLLFFKDLETGDIYCVEDSGCSCPTPFENVRSLADMTLVSNADDAIREFDYWNAPSVLGTRHLPIQQSGDMIRELFEGEAS